MFTGIISHLGKIKEKRPTGLSIGVPADLAKQLTKGGSISINGTCLTITKMTHDRFDVDVMPETWKKTALDDLNTGDWVNLELPCAISARLEGHIVQGHVDGAGTIRSITPDENSHILTISIDPSLARLCVDKGSIAVNGISLTIISAENDRFSVGIIPYTWKHTMLHTAGASMRVNIEIDVLAKYAHRLLLPYRKEKTI